MGMKPRNPTLRFLLEPELRNEGIKVTRYGLGCLVIDGDVHGVAPLVDFDALVPLDELERCWGHADIGTIVVRGNVDAPDGRLWLSHETLCCLIVLGDLVVSEFCNLGTEVRVEGALQVNALRDDEALVRVLGNKTIRYPEQHLRA